MLLGTDFEKGLSSSAALLRSTETDAAAKEIREFFHPLTTFFASVGTILCDFSVLMLVISALFCQVFAKSSTAALNIIIGFVFACALIRTLLRLISEYVTRDRITEDVYRVLRDGKVKSVKASALVRGDVLVLSKGDIAPLDLRLVESENLCVIEKYNGKRVKPVGKDAGFFPMQMSEIPLRLKKNMVFKGSAVTSGNALAVVIDERITLSQAKKIITINEDVEEYYVEKNRTYGVASRFTRRSAFGTSSIKERGYSEENSVLATIEKIASVMRVCGLFGGTCIFVLGIVAQVALSDAFMFGIVVTACAPMFFYEICVSVPFAIGSARLVRQGVTVKNFDSAEKLVLSKSIFCCGSTLYSIDKMVPEACYIGRSLDFNADNAKNIARLTELLLCSSELYYKSDKSGNQTVCGDIEGLAVLEGAKEIGIVSESTQKRYIRRISEFHDINGSLSAVFTFFHGKTLLISKGSAAQVLKKCSFYDIDGDAVKLDKAMQERILENAKSYENNESCRVVAVCYKPCSVVKRSDFHSDFVFAGFVVLGTRVNYNSSKYVKILRKYGISPVLFAGVASDMVLGDAKKLGILSDTDNYITAKSFASLDENVYSDDLESYTLYMGLSSLQKRAVVRSKKYSEKIVAVAADKPGDAFDMSEGDVLISFGKDAPKTLRRVSDIHSKSGGIDVIYRTLCICRNMIRCASLSAGYLMFAQIATLTYCFFGIISAFFTHGALPMDIPQLCCATLVTDLALVLMTALIRTPESIISDEPHDFYDFYKISKIIPKSFFAGVSVGCASFVSLLAGIFTAQNIRVATGCAFLTFYLSKCLVSLFCIMKTSTRKAPAHFPFIWAVAEAILGALLVASFGMLEIFKGYGVILPAVCVGLSLIPVILTKIYQFFDAHK